MNHAFQFGFQSEKNQKNKRIQNENSGNIEQQQKRPKKL